jgi:hypothetical protein
MGLGLGRPIDGRVGMGEHELYDSIRKCKSNDYIGKLEKIRIPKVSGRHEANFSV